MVVPDATFIACNRPGRLDMPKQSDLGEGVQRIIDSLMRDRRQTFADGLDDGFGIRMRMIADRLENGDPLFRHSQGTRPQTCGRVLFVSDLIPCHSDRMPASFD